MSVNARSIELETSFLGAFVTAYGPMVAEFERLIEYAEADVLEKDEVAQLEENVLKCNGFISVELEKLTALLDRVMEVHCKD